MAVESIIHPFDTLITRIQSPGYLMKYKNANGGFRPTMFRGLYQGIGPTMVTAIPSSVIFFYIYETAKSALLSGSEETSSEKMPAAAAYAISSAAAELASCAILNPAEVLKQNAQVSKSHGSGGHKYPVLTMLRELMSRPRKLWTGYTVLAASHLPGTTMTFCLYEYSKASWLERFKNPPTIPEQVRVSLFSAGVAGAAVSLCLVPIDVVKTRMRLAAGSRASQSSLPPKIIPISPELSGPKSTATSPQGPIAVARGILVAEGVRGLFRGASLTCVAAMLGSGLFLGCYDGIKLYSQMSSASQEPASPH